MDLRERKRVATMRRVQAVAMDLFEGRGFAEVTVEEIAAAAEVGPATVYRHFGTKEGIVRWDKLEWLPPLRAVPFARRGTTGGRQERPPRRA